MHVWTTLLCWLLTYTSAHVTTLGASNFTEYVNTHPMALVQFHAPWCTLCKRLAPEYAEAAAAITRERGEVVGFAEVDASVEADLAKQHEILGYPTLLFFRNGRPEPYSGGRSAKSISEWVQRMSSDVVEWFTTAAEVRHERTRHLEDNESRAAAVFVAILDSKESEAAKKFTNVANAQRLQGVFLALMDPTMSSADIGKVTVYRKDEDPVTTLIEDEDKLEQWVQTEAMPLFGMVAAHNYAKYAARSDHWIWFAGKFEDFETYAPIIRRVAANYRKEFNFVWLSVEEFGSHATDGLGLTTFPSIAMVWEKDKYHMEPEGLPMTTITERGLTKFIEAVKAGKVKRFLKSEPIPDTNDDDMKIVVGEEFSDWVFSKDHDMFLLIHAPWCGHCRKMMEAWEELAARVSSTGQLMVGKMDGTKNDPDVSGFEALGFPTIYFVPAGSNTPLLYDGDRSVDNFIQFARKHATYPVIDSVDDYHRGRKGEEL